MSGGRPPFSSRIPWIALSCTIILIDWITKRVAVAYLAPHHSVNVIPGLFDLTYVENPGGVFGLLRGLEDGARGVIFTLVPLAAIALIGLYALRIPGAHRLTLASLALILGGAVGNLLDRIRLGYVVDFIDVYWREYHWPAFNVADSAICVGVGLLLLETIWQPSENADPRPAPQGPAAAPGEERR